MTEVSDLPRSSISFWGARSLRRRRCGLDFVAGFTHHEAFVLQPGDCGELLGLEALGDLGVGLEDRLGQLRSAVPGADAAQERTLGGLVGRDGVAGQGTLFLEEPRLGEGSPFSFLKPGDNLVERQSRDRGFGCAVATAAGLVIEIEPVGGDGCGFAHLGVGILQVAANLERVGVDPALADRSQQAGGRPRLAPGAVDCLANRGLGVGGCTRLRSISRRIV